MALLMFSLGVGVARAAEPGSEASPVVSCYPIDHQSGQRVVVRRGKGAGTFTLNLWEKGKDAVEISASGKEYGEGRLKADGQGSGKDISLNVGNQFVLDSTLGNYSYLVGVLTSGGHSHELRCYDDEVHHWSNHPSLYRRVEAEDTLGLVQIAQGRLLSQGYSQLESVTKSERTLTGKSTVTLFVASAVYRKPKPDAKGVVAHRTLVVTGTQSGPFALTVDSARIVEGVASEVPAR